MRVVVDIGHGADTYPPGKGIGDFAEHTFNAEVGIRAKRLLEYNGLEVIFTQEPHKPEVPLSERISHVNREHREGPILCLISIHANASDNRYASGYGVFHWHTSLNGERLARTWDKHANKILPNGRWGSGVWTSSRGDWTNFAILRSTEPPAILLEHFFFTNKEELKIFNTPGMYDASAEVLVKAVCEYAGVDFRKLGEDNMDRVPIYIKGEKINVPSILKDGMTMVHIRQVLEALGHEVVWADGAVHVDPVGKL